MTEPVPEEARDVAQGRAWHTPFTAIGGVMLVVGIAAGLVIALALAVYLIL